MRRMRKVACLMAALAASLPGAAAHADDTGVYASAALGAAQENFGSSTFDVRGTNTGYKFALGLRPLSVIAAEASYINFGRSYGGINYADTYAEGLFALAFLPVPLVDLYGKVGLAEWRTNAHSPTLSFHRDGADAAYGVGVGTSFGRLGARLEYERYQVSHASDTAMASLGLVWFFL